MRAAIVIAAALVMSGCMGMTTRHAPLEVWPDMDRQAKVKPQSGSGFFADGRGNRMPVPGTVARGQYYEDEILHTGIQGDSYVGRNPLPITAEMLHRGQMRFNTYCSPCHDRTGHGQGLVPKKATWIPTNLHDERVKQMNDGELFNVISHGRRSMPPYKTQVMPQDRWAIVAYVRALQRTEGTLEDVPPQVQAQVR